MNDKDPGQGPLDGKKIVLLAEYYSSGGTRTYLKQLLDFYAASGADIVLVGIAPVPDQQVAKWLEECGFEYTCYWAIVGEDPHSSDGRQPSIWSPRFLLRERRAFRHFLLKTEAHGLVVSAGTPGQFVGAAGGSKSGLYVLHTYPHGKRQRFLGRWFMHLAVKGVLRLVAVSNFQKDEMIRLWGLNPQTSRISVVLNSAGPSLPAPVRTVTPPHTVIAASWLEPYKEPMEWLDVARMVSEALGHEKVRFVWYGEGGLADSCRERARELEELANVSFPGNVDEVDVAYAEADVYLQMSSTENMSLSVINALRHGLPAVCTRVGGLPEIEVDGLTGLLVDPHDTREAADAIIRLLEDPREYGQMAMQAWTRYDSHFSQQIWAERMLMLHLEALNFSSGSVADRRETTWERGA